MELTWEKWLVMGALAVISIALGMLPYLIFKYSSKNSIFRSLSSESEGSVFFNLTLTILSCFGGGVLLSTATVHMLPEARDQLMGIPSVAENFDAHFPLAEILTLAGFAAIYFVEEIAHWILALGDAAQDEDNDDADDDKHHHHHQLGITRHNSSIHSGHLADPRLCWDEESRNNKAAAESQFEDEKEEGRGNEIASTVRSALALIALSFHGIMEGIAVGIQESESLWFMFGAVASHKFVISFCMGVELYVTRAKLPTYVFSVVFFGVISSVGIFIGNVISTDGSNNLAIAVIQCLSTGTILYVVFFEILNRERSKKIICKRTFLSKFTGFIQFASISLGMTAMILLFTLVGHSHEHDHDHGLEGSTEDPDHDHDDDHDHHLGINSLPKLINKLLIQ